ncbi:MAG TPA: response regulator [bacterium]|nr:response regulator [bacterium]
MAKTILVVDDNRDFLRLMELLLTKAGYEVLLAESAVKASEVLEHRMPDAILLDIMMPVRNGLEFLENLRWEPRFGDVPVIVLTAMTLSAEEREFVETFATACLDKAQAAQVVDTLRELLPEP